jgi:hypothetical protein
MPLALTCGIGRTLSLLASAASAQVILIDGDTVDIDGIRIRLLDIDTRETGKPRCENELVLGLKEGTPAPTAGQRPGHLPSQRQGPLQPNPRPCLCQHNIDVGQRLIEEGLALRWTPGDGARVPPCRLRAGPFYLGSPRRNSQLPVLHGPATADLPKQLALLRVVGGHRHSLRL